MKATMSFTSMLEDQGSGTAANAISTAVFPVVPKCSSCGIPGAKKRCTPCKSAGIDMFYCDGTCQKRHWSTHRVVCAHLWKNRRGSAASERRQRPNVLKTLCRDNGNDHVEVGNNNGHAKARNKDNKILLVDKSNRTNKNGNRGDSDATTVKSRLSASGTGDARCLSCDMPDAKMRCIPCRDVGRDVLYCDRGCQKQNWATHRKICGVYSSSLLPSPSSSPRRFKSSEATERCDTTSTTSSSKDAPIVTSTKDFPPPIVSNISGVPIDSGMHGSSTTAGVLEKKDRYPRQQGRMEDIPAENGVAGKVVHITESSSKMTKSKRRRERAKRRNLEEKKIKKCARNNGRGGTENGGEKDGGGGDDSCC
mmetsp:Transcript_33609/g.77536  ORF Transcript_33609/g.77536 Transcript_33609/m.77536 type:complete len:365 (-) Transcript_33609:1587-2681(-)